MKPTVLLLGKNGLLGSVLRSLLDEKHDLIALGREDVDLADEAATREVLSFPPRIDMIVNAAAYSDVDGAESDEHAATAINTFLPEILAREALRRDIPLIHFSTDYVFDGANRRKPYRETDRANPLSLYGKTKLGGEIAVRETGARHLIFRTSGLYGKTKGFVPTMFRHAASGNIPEVVDDQVVTPNRVDDVAEAVAVMIERVLSDAEIPWGTYHLSGSGSTSWHGLACEIFRMSEKSTGEKRSLPIPVTTKEYGAPAERPPYSVLNADRLEATFGIRLPHWKTRLREYGTCRENEIRRSESC